MTDFPAISSHYKLPNGEMTILPLEPHHAEQLCSWQYEPPFQLYQWPSWQDMQKDGIEFGDSVLRQLQYAAVVNSRSELIGFAQFFPILGVTRLGLGLRPDLCGAGRGTALTKLIVQEARRRAPKDIIDLEVLTWNTRAIRTYEKAGFTIEDTYIRQTPTGPAEFHCMVYND